MINAQLLLKLEKRQWPGSAMHRGLSVDGTIPKFGCLYGPPSKSDLGDRTSETTLQLGGLISGSMEVT